ncbi:MAG: endolytic transglycosylase MltG [Patescibacteria group bacterium]|nr:endolytic transglycosylase MltG [Patescibacteria group bacterium]
MKKIFQMITFSFMSLFVILFVGYLWWSDVSSAVSTLKEERKFLIKKGQTAESIGQELYKQGFIKSPLAFKIYIQVKGLSDKIPSGEYLISPSYKLSEVVTKLLKGPVEIWVTIPEGLRLKEIVERLIDALEIPDAKAFEFRSEFFTFAEDKEGYLFPDTYLFPKDIRPKEIVSIMEANFERKVDQQMRLDIAKQGKTLHQVVILASIIERETKTEQEKPIVAGLLLARLREGFFLQTDAVLQYGLANEECHKVEYICTNWWPKITRSHYTDLKGPYNVYKYQGLPPTPICSPGLSSIKAVVYPEETDYRYYIHDKNGKIHFAKTLKEHNENVARYLK